MCFLISVQTPAFLGPNSRPRVQRFQNANIIEMQCLKMVVNMFGWTSVTRVAPILQVPSLPAVQSTLLDLLELHGTCTSCIVEWSQAFLPDWTSISLKACKWENNWPLRLCQSVLCAVSPCNMVRLWSWHANLLMVTVYHLVCEFLAFQQNKTELGSTDRGVSFKRWSFWWKVLCAVSLCNMVRLWSWHAIKTELGSTAGGVSFKKWSIP